MRESPKNSLICLKIDENGTYFPLKESLVGVVLGANAAESAVARVRQWVATALENRDYLDSGQQD